MDSLIHWLDEVIRSICHWAPEGTLWRADFTVKGYIAIVLVSLVAGGVGSLVVSNRMAFFSDALAHCAFAGVAFGLLIALMAGLNDETEFFRNYLTLTRVAFGIIFGLLIAYVHEKSSLPSDTVIGVFFAAALGWGAIFMQAVRNRKRAFDLDSFIFGSPLTVETIDLIWLFLLVIVTGVYLVFCYNSLIFGSFNASLARSRRVPARLARYLFVVLLGVIVNLCQQTVGILLINGLLIVPGAAAANLSNNLRQLIWRSLAISVFCGIFGMWLCGEINHALEASRIELGIGGTVLILSVAIFGLSMALGRLVKR